MTTYYYQPLPDLPKSLLAYFNQQGYPLSLKKKYIIAQILVLNTDTDIDLLLYKIGTYCSSVSRSSVYMVLQWMIANDLAIKTVYNDDLKVYYKANTEKLISINLSPLADAADFGPHLHSFATGV
jgi:Fe2+ or Zn2+ uptake regulation protein